MPKKTTKAGAVAPVIIKKTERKQKRPPKQAKCFADGIPVVEGVLWHVRAKRPMDAPTVFHTMSQRHEWQRKLQAFHVPDPRWK